MLVKWAIEGRRKTAKAKLSATEYDRHGGATTSAPFSTGSLTEKDRPQITGIPVEPETTAQALTAQLDRLNFEQDAALARSNESDGDRAFRRIRAEERDTMLRDDKLLALAGPDLPRHQSHPGSQEAQSSLPLTEANIEKLVHEQDGNSNDMRGTLSDRDSNIVNRAYSTTRTHDRVVSRPSLTEQKHRESEQTITREGPS
jgi:hypothetical protein